MSSAQTEVRSALAAYIDGVTPLQVFEQSVARLLAGRNSARSEVHEQLQAAVADGTLPRESLRRLGLVDVTPANAAENPKPDEKQQDIRARGRNAPRNREVARDQHPRAARTPVKRAPQIPECGALLGNRYRLDRVLGEGGMGVVFLATDQEVRGELFAIKVLRPEIRDNPESLRLLREEVRRTRALRHPHIVGVYSLNSDPFGTYMLMEYLEGKSLKTLLDEDFGRGMPLMRAWPLVYDVGTALAYAHDHNVVHSDIKPSNIIVTSSGFCKLLDFGIARADRHRTTIHDPTAIGALTPAYACCEMFEGRAPDQSDDVYAFACVIYEMLTGKHPYGRTNAVDARAKKLQPAPIKELTKRQNQALALALEFDRAQRTTSVEILLEGLKGKANNRRDLAAWAAAAAAVAAVTIVSTGWFLEHQASHRVPAAEMAQAPARGPEPDQAAVPPEPKLERAQEVPRTEGKAVGPSSGKAKLTAPVVVAAPPVNKAPPSPLTLSPAAPLTLSPAGPLALSSASPLALSSASPLTLSSASPLTLSPAASPRSLSPATPPTLSPATPPTLTIKATPPAPVIASTSEASAGTPPPAPLNTPSTVPEIAAPTAAIKEQVGMMVSKPAAGSSTVTARIDPGQVRPEDGPPGAAPPRSNATDAAAETAPASNKVVGLASVESIPLPPATPSSTAPRGEIDRPPFGKRLPAVVATPESQARMQSEEDCPYPVEARNAVQTGTVVLLVYVSPDGSAANAQLDGDGSSGSSSLDQAAVKCVREVGHFPPKLVGSKPVGYWARTKFVWSFGG